MNLNRTIQFFASSADEIGKQIKNISDKVQPILASVLGALAGFVALAAIVYSIAFLIKAGFSSEAEARKKHIKGLLWLWGSVLAILVIWGLAAGIVAAVGVVTSSAGF